MTIGGIALALFALPAAILASRLVEGAGYLVLVIATPALLAAISPDGWKPPVLAIWGGFVPIGFAVADFTAQAMLPAGDPQDYLLRGDRRLRHPGHASPRSCCARPALSATPPPARPTAPSPRP